MTHLTYGDELAPMTKSLPAETNPCRLQARASPSADVQSFLQITFDPIVFDPLICNLGKVKISSRWWSSFIKSTNGSRRCTFAKTSTSKSLQEKWCWFAVRAAAVKARSSAESIDM